MEIIALFVRNLSSRCREWWHREDAKALSATLARKRLLVGPPERRGGPYAAVPARCVTHA